MTLSSSSSIELAKHCKPAGFSKFLRKAAKREEESPKLMDSPKVSVCYLGENGLVTESPKSLRATIRAKGLRKKDDQAKRHVNQLRAGTELERQQAFKALCEMAAESAAGRDAVFRAGGLEGLRRTPVERSNGMNIVPKIVCGVSTTPSVVPKAVIISDLSASCFVLTPSSSESPAGGSPKRFVWLKNRKRGRT